ncbi:MAG: hypothetical protein M0R46_17690 [Candidatus Muirbacterium halophilum]|nr:hypothetical protein [Candidatus Muirbacterium halophilum]
MKYIKIIGVILFQVLLIYFIFNYMNNRNKETYSNLEYEYNLLINKQKQVELDIIKYQQLYDSLAIVDSNLTLLVEKYELDIREAEKKAKTTKDSLDLYRKDLYESLKKIEYFKNNLPNREGEELIESLKNKLKL